MYTLSGYKAVVHKLKQIHITMEQYYWDHSKPDSYLSGLRTEGECWQFYKSWHKFKPGL